MDSSNYSENKLKYYFSSALGAALVYDTTNLNSFENIEKIWIPLIKNYAYKNIKLVLIGTKLDLVQSNSQETVKKDENNNQDNNVSNQMKYERQVPVNDGILLAKKYDMDFIEVSSKTGENVEEIMRHMIYSIVITIPQIKIQLEVNNLPYGWSKIDEIDHYNSQTYTKMNHSSNNINNNIENIRKVNELPSSESVSSLISKNNYLYINYWTGETQTSIPTKKSEGKLLFESTNNYLNDNFFPDIFTTPSNNNEATSSLSPLSSPENSPMLSSYSTSPVKGMQINNNNEEKRLESNTNSNNNSYKNSNLSNLSKSSKDSNKNPDPSVDLPPNSPTSPTSCTCVIS